MTYRVALAEQLIASPNQPDLQVDELKAFEAECRIDAYDDGEMRVIPLKQVIGYPTSVRNFLKRGLSDALWK